MNVRDAVRKYGIVGSARRCADVGARIGKRAYYRWATRNALCYQNPTDEELARIEHDLAALGVRMTEYRPSLQSFEKFRECNYFPANYHGGLAGGVWDEKLLEHWISSELLGLSSFDKSDIYVDVAAATSPWAKTVRERMGLQAFAIDLEVSDDFKSLPYYRAENATATTFAADSVRGVSLHCAYEMFSRDDDVNLLSELARILKPGGKAVILPLYMHTHYCAYSTPEFYGRGYSDPLAKEYVRYDTVGVPSSRKYDAKTLQERILKRIEALGMRHRLYTLPDKSDFGQGIYCHFILEIQK